MLKITEQIKSLDEANINVPSGICMTFENGNTVSIQFGYGNYSSNRVESKSETQTAEIAMWNKDNKWYTFKSENDHVLGWQTSDEVAYWIDFCKNNKF